MGSKSREVIWGSQIRGADHQPDRRQDAENAADSESQRYGIQLEETALFLLVIDDVQSVDDSFYAAVRAPDCQQQAYDQCSAKFDIAFRENMYDLFLDDCKRDLR
jgi:hypothetical protein